MTETATACRVHGGDIVVHLDALLFARGMTVKELADAIGIHPNNLSKLKNNRVEGYRRETLASICAVLECQIGELLEFVPPAQG